MTIFNRWGQQLFQTNSLEIGWDGKLDSGKIASSGTYFYLIEYTYIKNQILIKNSKKGSVTLLK